MTKLERIMYVVDRLMETGAVSKKKVAEHCGVTDRQVRRDFSFLAETGIFDLGRIRLEYDPYTGLHKADEMTKERLLRWRIRKGGATAEHGSMGLDGMSESSIVRRDSRYIVHKSYAKEEFSLEFYSILMDAMSNSLLIKMSYGDREEKIMHPLRLVQYGELWYLYAAYPNDRKKRIYTYNLSRIKSLSLTDEKAEWDRDQNHRIDEVSRCYGIFYGTGEDEIYTIAFTGWAAENVDAQIWQENQKKEWSEDGKTLYLSFPVSNPTELMGRVLFYGECAEPVNPESFVRDYREHCRKMGKRYEEETIDE